MKLFLALFIIHNLNAIRKVKSEALMTKNGDINSNMQNLTYKNKRDTINKETGSQRDAAPTKLRSQS